MYIQTYKKWNKEERRKLVWLIAEGDSFLDISGKLGRTIEGVKKETRKIRKKHGARSLPHLVKISIEKKII